MKFNSLTRRLVDLLFVFLVCWGIPAIALAQFATPISTAQDFMAVASPDSVGQVPYFMSLLALLGIPIVVQGIKSIKDLPTWVLWALPTGISLVTACVTALAQGHLPWTAQGLNIVIAIMIGGVGGQGVYVANEQRVKRGTINRSYT